MDEWIDRLLDGYMIDCSDSDGSAVYHADNDDEQLTFRSVNVNAPIHLSIHLSLSIHCTDTKSIISESFLCRSCQCYQTYHLMCTLGRYKTYKTHLYNPSVSNFCYLTLVFLSISHIQSRDL